jgi:hypothetical protein
LPTAQNLPNRIPAGMEMMNQVIRISNSFIATFLSFEARQQTEAKGFCFVNMQSVCLEGGSLDGPHGGFE